MIAYMLLLYIGVKICAPLWYWLLWGIGIMVKPFVALIKFAINNQ